MHGPDRWPAARLREHHSPTVGGWPPCDTPLQTTPDTMCKVFSNAAEGFRRVAGLTQAVRAAVRLGEVVRGRVAAAVEQHENALGVGHPLPDNLHSLHCLWKEQALAEETLKAY